MDILLSKDLDKYGLCGIQFAWIWTESTTLGQSWIICFGPQLSPTAVFPPAQMNLIGLIQTDQTLHM